VHRPDLDAAVEAIILRAIAKDRSLRFQAATELYDALAPYVPSSALAQLAPPVR